MTTGSSARTDRPLRELDADELALWIALIRVGQLLPTRLDDDLREVGSSLARYEVLAVLDRSELGVRLTELCRLALVSKPRISVHVHELVAEGYVRRDPDPRDGRASLVAITPAGRALLRQWRPRHLGLARELVVDVVSDPDDRRVVTKTLQAILAALGDPCTHRAGNSGPN